MLRPAQKTDQTLLLMDPSAGLLGFHFLFLLHLSFHGPKT